LWRVGRIELPEAGPTPERARPAFRKFPTAHYYYDRENKTLYTDVKELENAFDNKEFLDAAVQCLLAADILYIAQPTEEHALALRHWAEHAFSIARHMTAEL
jgi:hypothetical protein